MNKIYKDWLKDSTKELSHPPKFYSINYDDKSFFMGRDTNKSPCLISVKLGNYLLVSESNYRAFFKIYNIVPAHFSPKILYIASSFDEIFDSRKFSTIKITDIYSPDTYVTDTYKPSIIVTCGDTIALGGAVIDSMLGENKIILSKTNELNKIPTTLSTTPTFDAIKNRLKNSPELHIFKDEIFVPQPDFKPPAEYYELLLNYSAYTKLPEEYGLSSAMYDYYTLRSLRSLLHNAQIQSKIEKINAIKAKAATQKKKLSQYKCELVSEQQIKLNDVEYYKGEVLIKPEKLNFST